MSCLQCLSIVFLMMNGLCSSTIGSGHLNKLMLKQSPNIVSSNSANPGRCVQDARCEPIENVTCFGIALPYTHTSLDLAEDSLSLLEVQDNLAFWQGLRSVPRCWAVIQPLLCAVYMPKCENGTLSLPSQEMCRVTRGPCRVVEEKQGWPPFLRCENKKIFPPGCRNPLQELKFNTTSKCLPPLVETDNPDSWYENVEGCGLQCRNPLFTDEEHGKVHSFIGVMASLCLAANLFAVLTFLISWKVSNRYPAVIIFYINACLLVTCLGWLIQFVPGAKEEIVCLHDGTVRRKQPRSGEHLCSITFILIYSFLLAALVWFVILAYAWYVLFRENGAPKDIVKKKVAYFHLSAWCIPLVLTTIVMAMKEVDGDSISGICFVGYANPVMRVGFLLVPVAAAAVVGGFFLVAGLYTLVKVKLGSQEVANEQVKKRIRRMTVKIGAFLLLSLLFVLSTFSCHVYDFSYRSTWEEDLRDYIICLATLSASSSSSSAVSPATCVQNSRPSISMVQIHLLSFFGFGIVMSSWVWTRVSLESWKLFFYKLCCEPPKQEGLALKRHQLIAKAFQHRNEINQGHFSFSINSTHDDPVGMNLDVNSIASRELSSSWAAALPQFLSRRNAVTNFNPLGLKHYSSASDVSARRISLDSYHQQNLDSLSLQMSEQEYAHVLRHQRRKTRKERERFLRANRIAPWFPSSRRGSDTSVQSSIIAAAAAVARASVAKVTKATSTGDLNNVLQVPFIRPPTLVTNRLLPQRPVVPNLPFTHGMTDNSHCVNASNKKKSPETGYLTAPRNNAGTAVPGAVAAAGHSPLLPFFSQNYGLAPRLPYGYFPGLMGYPGLNGMYPAAGYMPMAAMAASAMSYMPYGSVQYMHVGQCATDADPGQTPLIPLHPTLDSASEAEYLPIVLSDSEFTDGGGHFSYDEAQLLSAQRLLQEHSLRVASQSCGRNSVSKPPAGGGGGQAHVGAQYFINKDPEICHHSLSCARGGSGRQSPHSEAPPPSPVDSVEEAFEDFPFCGVPKTSSRQSLRSVASVALARGDGDDTASSATLRQSADNLLQRFKSKLKRAASFSHGTRKTTTESLELDSRTRSPTVLRRRDDCGEKDRDHGETSKALLGEDANDVPVETKRTLSALGAENVSR